MKKMYIVGSLFVLGTLLSFPNAVFAQTTMPSKVVVKDLKTTPDPKATATAMLKPKSDYTLPYPGILPDHPLYFLKTFRDRIIEILVSEPIRKAEFFLLQSDKWLSAAEALQANGKKALAQTILDESATRMRSAVAQLVSVQENGKSVPRGTIDRFINAVDKHLEVIDVIQDLDVTQAKSLLLQSQEELGKLK